MLIEFKTNASGNASGFYAEYSCISPSWCQGLKQFTEPNGTFSDGSGDFYYQSHDICLWQIIPPYANKIILNFNYFETEEGADIVTVYDGTTKIAEFSGNQVPDPVEANSGSMFITWNSNNSNNFQGWEAYYEVDNVGLNEDLRVGHLEVFPNPSSEKLHISFQSEIETDLMINIMNVTGQKVYSENLPVISGLHQSEICVSDLPAGIYFLEIITSTGKINKKLLIQ